MQAAPSSFPALQEQLFFHLSASGIPCKVSGAKEVLLLKQICELQIKTVSVLHQIFETCTQVSKAPFALVWFEDTPGNTGQ